MNQQTKESMSVRNIAYILSRFPVLTETFIIREIEELRNKKIKVEVFSLKSPNRQEAPHSNTEELIKTTHYYPYLFSLRVWNAFFFYLRTKPITCCNIFSKIFKTHIKNPVLLLKTLFITPKAFAIAGALRELGIARIHAHWATIPTTVAWIISNLNDCPYTFTAHAWDIYQVDTMLEDKLHDAAAIITISDYNKKYLERKFPRIDSEKIKIIHYGLDFKKFSPHYVPQEKKFTILSIGRLTEKKGFDILIRACKILKEEQIPFLCQIIYVSGNFEKEIFQLYGQLDLNGFVEFIPELSQEDVITHYLSADCFVLPCRIAGSNDRDGIPNVILEALAMELPVVTTPISGIPEVMENDKTGLLVNPENADELAIAIERLYSDKELRRKLGKAGRDFVIQHFEISSNVDRLLKIIF